MTSAAEAEACFRAGALRAELCRDLDADGLTPAAAEVLSAVAAQAGPIFVLVRRAADTFTLSPAETAALIEDVASMAALHVDGLVVGVLDRAGRVDECALTELISAAGGLPVTFHRAIDQVENPLAEVESLIRAGVSRVLTSGGAPTAWQGRATLRELVALCAEDLTVLGGGGIRGNHVRELVQETGLTEVHARASAIPDISAALTGMHS